jgi:thiol-disulfide isomerase/thioredoxin
MKITIILFFIFLICCNVFASEELIFYFQNLHRITKPANPTPLYFLTFDTLRFKNKSNESLNKTFRIKFPDMRKSKDTAYFKEYFTGWENPLFDRSIMFLVGNYKSDTTYIWADLNCNLDFTDDNAFYTITKENPGVFISLINSKNLEGNFLYKFEKISFNDTTFKNAAIEHYAKNDKKKGIITTDVDYWFANTRLNVLSCDTIIDGKKVQICLMDWNCNGLFNDIETLSNDNFLSDRILIGEYGAELISSKPSAGAVILLPETLIPNNGKIYKLLEVEPTGKYLRIKQIDTTYHILKIGDTLPDLEYKLVNGDKTSLNKQLANGKYNLIDFWGFWCKGCIHAIPKLKELNSKYSDKLNIIGLHDYKSKKQSAIQTIEKYNLQWSIGYLTPEIEKEFAFFWRISLLCFD